ncbi:Uncharacterised protein [uncultured Roseburia sp.]|uniref:DUF4190 domain-containing protein n=1 Tax=Brotonthovivens ammoniilytica TaxID=2981725 RepID=A0ABT2TK06_9FIRM|nr:hypothetical protein [Brotonthovivens ammoniilytica]MCU6762486.1 hypothetical protein [Brotonthovivens ammoniilytica]SCI73410.1 Uncharacterised protein [uncultured Roseburia sp.]
MGIVSLVLGIIAIIVDAATLGVYGFVGVILGIIGIIFGVLGRKKAEGRGLATAGLVCSIVGLILGLALYVACVACIGAGVAALGGL